MYYDIFMGTFFSNSKKKKRIQIKIIAICMPGTNTITTTIYKKLLNEPLYNLMIYSLVSYIFFHFFFFSFLFLPKRKMFHFSK